MLSEPQAHLLALVPVLQPVGRERRHRPRARLTQRRSVRSHAPEQRIREAAEQPAVQPPVGAFRIDRLAHDLTLWPHGDAGRYPLRVDAIVARKTWRTLEPYHGVIYFGRESSEAYASIGITDRMMGYFGSRAAAMGAVPAEVVIATFF